MEGKNPVLWSDKNPSLYTLELQLWIENRLVNTQVQKIGIRSIVFNKDQGMVVNGEKVIIKGGLSAQGCGFVWNGSPERCVAVQT